MAENVVPLTPDVEVHGPGTQQMIEFAVQSLLAKEKEWGDIHGIAFVLFGPGGESSTGHFYLGLGDRTHNAMAGAVLLREATKDPED